MATHSSILAWEIPWTEEPGGLQRVGSTERLRFSRCESMGGCDAPVAVSKLQLLVP